MRGRTDARQTALRRENGVRQKHGDRHGTDAARHGRKGRSDLGHVGRDVAAELPFGVAVDADVDHDAAGLHHVRGNEVLTTDGGDENVGRAREFG